MNTAQKSVALMAIFIAGVYLHTAYSVLVSFSFAPLISPLFLSCVMFEFVFALLKMFFDQL
jgi:hypothetical protein